MEKIICLCICVIYMFTFLVIPGKANQHYSSYNSYSEDIVAQGHHSRHEQHHSHSNNGHNNHNNGIVCYQCNSEYDPRCGDPFDPYTLGVVNCSMRTPPEHLNYMTATLCRKTVQRVYGKTRVIRGCGYVTDERDDKMCLKRSGTHDVHVLYCACTKSLCNRGITHFQTSSYNIILIETLLIVGIFTKCINYL